MKSGARLALLCAKPAGIHRASDRATGTRNAAPRTLRAKGEAGARLESYSLLKLIAGGS